MISADASVDDAGGRSMSYPIGVRRFRGIAIGLVSAVLAAGLISAPALAATAPTASAAPATSAGTATSTTLPLTPPRVRVDPGATIRARGAAAVVALDVACFGQPVRTLEVDVEQTLADGSTVASAGYASINGCSPKAQRILAPLQGNYCTENSFCGSATPIRPGPATVGVYYYDCNSVTCNDHFYPRAPATLSYLPVLDHRTSAALSLGRYATLVAHGTAAYIYLHATCSGSEPGANAGQVSLTETVAGSVTYSHPDSPTSPVCSPGSTRWFRVLMKGAPLVAGPAYVLYDDLAAVVTLR
jgi:hypothetical protein